MTLPCPRRLETGAAFTPPESDHWRADQTCSYCGSLSPAAFLAALDAGARIGPTEKSHKAYVTVPNPHAGRKRIISSTLQPLPDYQLMTAELAETVAWAHPDDPAHYLGRYVRLGDHGPTEIRKFYFQHFDEVGQRRFIALHNAGRLNIGAPGYFFVRPFFCLPVETA